MNILLEMSCALEDPDGLSVARGEPFACRTKRLTEEERAHWTQVLFEDPTNGEAQSRLSMKWYRGNLLTIAQIDAIKKQQAAEEKLYFEGPTISGPGILIG